MAEETEAESSSSQNSFQRSLEDALRRLQGSGFSGFPAIPTGDVQIFPIMYPALVPTSTPLQAEGQNNRRGGIYAVPVFPQMGPVAGLPTNTLIPLTYNVPTGPRPEAGPVSERRPQAGGQQQQPAPQREVVVRRFQIAFQIDLLLMLKLAALIFLFNQDGSRQRLVVLVFFASLIYLYQTGALTPLVRWLSQSMQRAAAPPHPPRAAARAENGPADARQGIENVVAADQHVAGAENHPANGGDQVAENENAAEPGGGNGGNHWWGILKEIQIVVFGFITSLLPGFHNVD